jgi:hypothetical protein
MALHDLDSGCVVPMLRPASGFDHRRRESSIRQVIKGYVNLYVDVLLSAGCSVEEACRVIAGELERKNFAVGMPGKEGPPWKTVKSWRDRISKLPEDSQERRVLAALRTQYSSSRFPTMEAARAAIIDGFGKTLRPYGRAALE